MTKEVTLAQLAAEMVQLRQQLETMNQRLDMIYGAVTRLTNQASPAQTAPAQTTPPPQPNPTMSAADMMSPDSMLDSLRQHAIQQGLDISTETVDRLKTQIQPVDEDET